MRENYLQSLLSQPTISEKEKLNCLKDFTKISKFEFKKKPEAKIDEKRLKSSSLTAAYAFSIKESKSLQNLFGGDFLEDRVGRCRAASADPQGPKVHEFEVEKAKGSSKGLQGQACQGSPSWVSLDLEPRPPSFSFSRVNFCHSTLDRPRTENKSTPDLCKKTFDDEKDFKKFKRSLKLLGFDLSDFGIYDTKSSFCQKSSRPPPTKSTKTNSRSISLDSLRREVKTAWAFDCLDDSYRKLMAQAVYEQWYSQKKIQLLKKREEDLELRKKVKDSLEKEFEQKKRKAEEEFQKWVREKKAKRKNATSTRNSQGSTLRNLKKTEEQVENAFLKWKKEKDEEMEKRIKKQKQEKERKIELEKQKKEKRASAEKAFQLWKKKLNENEKLEAEKQVQRKKEERLMLRRKKSEESGISFQEWKAQKDQQIMKKVKQSRQAAKKERIERKAQLEERMYEAEQAFEEWLEKIDLRQQKLFSHSHTEPKKVPWMPG